MSYLHRPPVCCVIPPYILYKLMARNERVLSETALNTLLATTALSGERKVRSLSAVHSAPDTGRRTAYDCRHSRRLTNAALARTEDGAASADASVNRAFDGFGSTRTFYKQILNRDSIDDKGMRLNAYVHFGSKFQNAYWDGQEMVFGDGDGEVFDDFTKSIDVIAHELTHGVTEYTANLDYHGQSGALNESISDVFGSLVKQWTLRQKADEADWLIGAGIFTPSIAADALRSMKAPGTAFDNAFLGKDPQPDHMSRYDALPDTEQGDWGGVHTNSGIPNKAFYVTAINIGSYAWEAAGHVWYESLKASTNTTQFQEFADTTYAKAGQLYGAASNEQKGVGDAWQSVGIRISGPSLSSPDRDTQKQSTPANERDSLLLLGKQLQSLSDQLSLVTREVEALKLKGD